MRRYLLAAGLMLALSGAAEAATPKGVWANPRNTVHVVFAKCGRAICGRIVWASPQAESDARAGGGDKLAGQMLFRNFVEREPGTWAGSVLIPDLGQTVSGTIQQIDARTLRGEGCLFAGLGCKSQTWTRVQ